MKKTRAAIDIGTHTARLLIASAPKSTGNLRSLARRREYIRLAESFDYLDTKTIHTDAINITLKVLQDFIHDIKTFEVQSIHAIATGILREAKNSSEFLERIHNETGIQVNLVSGDEEALLTAKGVLHTLGAQSRPLLIFDLGGGTTELFFGDNESNAVKSIPLGAMVLTKIFLKSDPPQNTQIDALSEHIDHLLETLISFPRKGDSLPVVGTGGTATTLAMMLYGIEPEDISPERINGLTLERKQMEILFDKMKNINFDERLSFPGLDKGRSGIILAGILVIIRILHFFKETKLTVSMSDLLEGILIQDSF